MALSKEHLVMNDIILYIKAHSSSNIPDVYSDIIRNGKYRNYLTSNKFFAIITKLERNNIINRTDGVLSLVKKVKHMTHKDILVRALGRWPIDIENGLG